MATQDGLVLVSGATGHQGGAIARELLRAAWPVRAMTRNPDGDAARALTAAGAEVVRADLNDAASVQQAMKSAWGAVAVQNTWEAGVAVEEEQGKTFARVAKDAGIQHLVYQSVASAHRNSGIPHFDNKWRIEQTIQALGIPSWTVIRPVFFMENLLSAWFKPQIDQGSLSMGIDPRTRLQMIAVRDIGKYGSLAVQRHTDLNGRSIDVAGDEITGPQAAAILSEVTGRAITFHQVPIEQVRAGSEETALMYEWFDAVGYDVDIARTAAEFGVGPTRFAEWAWEQDWS